MAAWLHSSQLTAAEVGGGRGGEVGAVVLGPLGEGACRVAGDPLDDVGRALGELDQRRPVRQRAGSGVGPEYFRQLPVRDLGRLLPNLQRPPESPAENGDLLGLRPAPPVR